MISKTLSHNKKLIRVIDNQIFSYYLDKVILIENKKDWEII
jgi:hypothetical protein